MDTYTICSQITAKALYDQCLSLRNDTDTGCKNENNEYYLKFTVIPFYGTMYNLYEYSLTYF